MKKEDVIERWRQSNKKHLIITGDLGRGKSTIFNSLVAEFECDFIKTHAVYKDSLHPIEINCFSSKLEESFVLARFKNNMQVEEQNLKTKGVRYLNTLESEVVGIDEIGYLENNVSEYIDSLVSIFDSKTVIATARKNKKNEIFHRLMKRNDICLIDLDEIRYDLDIVVMASGHSRRYGKNKLLEPWGDGTLLEATLSQIPYDMVNEVVVVTRYESVARIVNQYPARCILHNEEYQSDTIRIGIEALNLQHEATMFLTCDQPLRTKRSLRSMILESYQHKQCFIQLAYGNRRGNPIIFPKNYDTELKKLKDKETGKTIVKRYPNQIYLVEALHPYELIDIDTQDTYHELKNIFKSIGKG